MTDSDIKNEIEQRNQIRTAAGLPLLDHREAGRLKSAREERAFEAIWAVEEARYSHEWTNNTAGFWTNMGRYVQARHKVRSEVKGKD